ncbi:MAG: alpha-amylase family glycosyl hydrolase, partial [Thermodesulfobacteriota bacterium]
MKKIVLFALLCTVVFSCKKEEAVTLPKEIKTDISPITPELVENAVIYEASIRQYSEEGTFKAFTSDIPKLKKMGVKILWLMPIHEIGIKNRKAKTDTLIEQITDTNEKQKYLGNPYAVKDYRSLNRDFGTKEDFIQLVKTAH